MPKNIYTLFMKVVTMHKKNLLIAGGLIGAIVVLSAIGFFIIIPAIVDTSTAISNSITDKACKLIESIGVTTFDNSTPEATAVSIARLNLGEWGFNSATIKSVHLTSRGKYWIVEIYNSVYQDGFDVVTVDAKTWASKIEDKEWKSLDELKAVYIAEIQSDSLLGKPHKITMEDKEIWKVPVSVYSQENDWLGQDEYVYVDVATGKSKNTWGEFNEAAGTGGWLTLKQVDDTINKMQKEMDALAGVTSEPSFKDALRDLYPE